MIRRESISIHWSIEVKEMTVTEACHKDAWHNVRPI